MYYKILFPSLPFSLFFAMPTLLVKKREDEKKHCSLIEICLVNNTFFFFFGFLFWQWTFYLLNLSLFSPIVRQSQMLSWRGKQMWQILQSWDLLAPFLCWVFYINKVQSFFVIDLDPLVQLDIISIIVKLVASLSLLILVI